VSTEAPIVDSDAPSVSCLQASTCTDTTSQTSPDTGGVTIEYCAPGNLERVARELADAIYAEFGAETRLVESRDGAFEVRVDGRLIFSKRASWRLPDVDEIFYHVRHR